MLRIISALFSFVKFYFQQVYLNAVFVAICNVDGILYHLALYVKFYFNVRINI